MSPSMWVLWKSCSNRTDAELLIGLLQSVGIEGRIASADGGGVTPHLAFADGWHVEVLQEEQAAADELLEAGPVAPPPDWNDGEVG